MQATLSCLSRIVSRTLVGNAATGKDSCATGGGRTGGNPRLALPVTRGPPHRRYRQLSTTSIDDDNDTESQKDQSCTSSSQQEQTRLLTAVSGFPKSESNYKIDHILKGQIGDDAFFIARHVDEWSTNYVVTNVDETSSSSTSLEGPAMFLGRRRRRAFERRRGSVDLPTASEQFRSTALHSGESAIAAESIERSVSTADVIGVADGVGGWRQYGVDPGQFSRQLMQSCERLVRAGYFVSSDPVKLLAQGFLEMQESKKEVIGSSTACLAMLSHADGKLYTANIGDSGLLVVRNGRVVHRSLEQQHYFNTPFQLSLPPSEMASDVLSDRPEAADRYEFNVQDGDIIVLATDGMFDNVPDDLLIEQLEEIRGCTNDLGKIQACANSIALIARSLSKNETFLSPFARNARSNGYHNVVGGKEDDITVVLAAVTNAHGGAGS